MGRKGYSTRNKVSPNGHKEGTLKTRFPKGEKRGRSKSTGTPKKKRTGCPKKYQDRCRMERAGITVKKKSRKKERRARSTKARMGALVKKQGGKEKEKSAGGGRATDLFYIIKCASTSSRSNGTQGKPNNPKGRKATGGRMVSTQSGSGITPGQNERISIEKKKEKRKQATTIGSRKQKDVSRK